MNELKNNLDLDILFTQLTIEYDNIFDIYEELDKYKNAYKDLSIAKIVPDIYKAYELHYSHQDITAKIFNAISHADWSPILESLNIENLFEQIPEEYKESVVQLIKEATKEF